MSAPQTEAPELKGLTVEEKVTALYLLSQRQGRLQFMPNFGWAVCGILGGYLAGRVLPH